MEDRLQALAALRKVLIIFLSLILPLCAFAEEHQALLHVPKDKVNKPLLFGSRIMDVNRSWGKVYAPGQRNPRPKLVQFTEGKKDGTLVLKSLGSEYVRPGSRGHFSPIIFYIMDETPEEYVINITNFFSTYPVAVSAIPPKVLEAPAAEHEILDVSVSDEYIQVTGHYVYACGIDVTAACYLIFLDEEPMPWRTVDPKLAGYNGVDIRLPGSRHVSLSHRWRVKPGKTIDFYVDRSFPDEWYPYIKEGIEDWNKAFRKIGLGDVLAVHPEPADGSLDRYSPLVNMVRYIDVDEANAKGDVLVDSRSGEVLQGDILWWRDVVELISNWRYVQTGAADPEARREEYPIEILGPMIRHAVCHEMGHVLGLGHNMGASWAYPADSLRNVHFTQKYGTAASVMDYARYNHLATAADVRAGVNLMPPRIGPYDYYAIALGYGDGDAQAGDYCYFAPFISAAISPDPSAQPETLGDDLLRSSRTGLGNCRALLEMDGLTPERVDVLSSYYYNYIWLTLSNIGGVVSGTPVARQLREKTMAFVMESLASVPPQLVNTARQKRVLDELEGNFLPQRVKENCGEKELERYYRRLRCLHRRYDKQLTNNTNYDKNNL